MIIYYVPLIVCGIFAILSLILPRKFSNFLFLLLVLFCIIISGTRFESDFDFDNYVAIFNSIPPLGNGWAEFHLATANLYLEPTFALFVSFLKMIIPDLGIFIIISAISLLIYYFVFKKNAAYPLLAFLIYLGDGFYLREFTQVRFGLAVAFGLLSMISLKENRIFRQWVYISLACFFHFTAIMLISTNIWVKYVCKRRTIIAISTILFVFSLIGLFDGLINYIASIGLAPQRILDHIGTEDAQSISKIALIASYGILLWMLKIIPDDDSEFFWVQIYALSFTFLCLFSGFDLMRRVAFYFSIAVYLVSSVALKGRKYGFVILTLAYAVFLFYSRLNILYPYQSWLV